jgi:hypothetical protein
MAGRGRTTFKKRQKEQIRLERREQKAARKLARKASREGEPGGPEIAELDPADVGLEPLESTPDQQ